MGLSENRVGATIAVSDMEVARGFYEGKLGLAPGPMDQADGVLYRCGEGTSLLVYHSPDHAGGSTATLATWEVPDLERTVDELTAKGVSFARYEGLESDERGIHSAAGQGRIAWCKDPEGNTIAIGQFG
jgi:catechol 2,3-dioxygenase-like lactoylglutathione lyase family enzyme